MIAQEEADLYRRFQEVHLQRAYPRETVERLLWEAGFKTIVCGADFTWEEPRARSERYFFWRCDESCLADTNF